MLLGAERGDIQILIIIKTVFDYYALNTVQHQPKQQSPRRRLADAACYMGLFCVNENMIEGSDFQPSNKANSCFSCSLDAHTIPFIHRHVSHVPAFN